MVDGYITKYGKEIRETLEGCNLQLSKIEPKRGHFIIHHDGNQIKIPYSPVALFPKRAILRVWIILKWYSMSKPNKI
ncbi:hypothetical protein KOW_00512 [Bacillus cereus VDM006]|nr:hypothetical protein KOW_00512 [Bacillus cereus VDM006]